MKLSEEIQEAIETYSDQFSTSALLAIVGWNVKVKNLERMVEINMINRRLLRFTMFMLIVMGVVLLLTACVGPAGPAGSQGPPGQEGAQGPQGLIGPAGADGTSSLDKQAVNITDNTDIFCGPGILASADVDGAWVLEIGGLPISLRVWARVPAHDCKTIMFVPSVQPKTGLGNSKVTWGSCHISTSRSQEFFAGATWKRAPDGRMGIMCQMPTGYMPTDSGAKPLTGLYPAGDKEIRLWIEIP